MRNSTITVYHLCCSSGDQANGMTVVIPKHVKEQARYINTCLINLRDYRFQEVSESCNSYNIYDLRRLGIKKIYELNGKPDLYVIHGVYLPEIWKYWGKYIYHKVPYIMLPHGSLTRAIQQKNCLKKRIANAIVINNIVHNASALQFLSKDEKNNSIYGNNRSFVCPNGIYIPELSPKFNQNDLTLVYIGRIDIYHKGLDIMLEAVLKCRELCKKQNVKIHIYGPDSSNDYSKIKKLITEYQISEIIELRGSVFGKEKEKCLLSASFFIQTSRLEGLPMGILEAMSYGLPLLITNGTYMGEQINTYHNGCVQPTTVDGVCKLINFAIENKNNLKELSNNSKKCAKQYSWEIISQRETRMYEKIVSNESLIEGGL